MEKSTPLGETKSKLSPMKKKPNCWSSQDGSRKSSKPEESKSWMKSCHSMSWRFWGAFQPTLRKSSLLKYQYFCCNIVRGSEQRSSSVKQRLGWYPEQCDPGKSRNCLWMIYPVTQTHHSIKQLNNNYGIMNIVPPSPFKFKNYHDWILSHPFKERNHKLARTASYSWWLWAKRCSA